MAALYPDPPQRDDSCNLDPQSEANIDKELYDACFSEQQSDQIVSQGVPFDDIVNIRSQPPPLKDMTDVREKNFIFMISPFKYDPSKRQEKPSPINTRNRFEDRWDKDHVYMPCSPANVTKKREPIWKLICKALKRLKSLCDNKTATVKDLMDTIEVCNGTRYDLTCLEKLISEHYSNEDRAYFMSTVLSNICSLAMNIDSICSRSLPLLRNGSNKSVTMSQEQAASLLACAFFCLFPHRSNRDFSREFENFQNPNFDRLYEVGSPEKIEKLKCILHYFKRVTEKMPNGVITFQRVALSKKQNPKWFDSKEDLSDLHLTTGRKIEDIHNVLQVDFANKYIGGGVLGNGCVQEEIRFAICPEMLVSLLLCEVMEDNECVFLIGCEQYSKYKGYAQSFQFDGDFHDYTTKDSWGRRWCHLVAIDAIFFRDKTEQYDMKKVDRELLKAYVGFRPMGNRSEYHYGIATGNWGCGIFNGDRQLKAMIQLTAASEANRPLIYSAFADRNLVNSFAEVYNSLKKQKATVRDLYHYLYEYSRQYTKYSLFEFIMQTPLSKFRH